MRMRLSFRLFTIAFLLLASTLSCSQTQPFRFAWLSDTHVGSPTGAADLNASVHDINTLHGIAFVIVSGDIGEMGSDAQLTLAKSMLDSLKFPYYIIPGNHDAKWSESGCTEFTKLWKSDKFMFQYAGYRFIGLCEGPIMKMGDGHFAPEDMRWIDSVLTNLPDKGQPLIMVTHYPVDNSIDNWYLMTDLLKHYNTQVVLVGHGHANLKLNFEGIPGVMGRSNLRAGQSGGGYNIVDVRSDTMYFTERRPGIGTETTWDKVPLGERDYATDTTTYPRPSFAINREFPHARTAWTVNTGYTIASTPAVWKDHVIVGNSSGFVTSYSLRDGARQWTFKTGATVYSTPSASNGLVVFGSSDDNIYCLNAATGRLAWKHKTGEPVVAAPEVEGGVVYIGSSDSTFRAIDLKSGKLKWRYKGIDGFVETRPLVYHGKVVFGAWSTYLYALDSTDGSLAWKWSNGNTGLLYSPAACWPVGADNKIFIVAPDRYLTAIDAATGKAVWQTNRYHVRECICISNDGERVYARTMEDTVFAFSPTKPSLSTSWVTDCRYGYDIDPSMPVEKDGVVFFGTQNGFVYAMQAKTGKILWKHRVGVTVVNTPVPLDAHRVIVNDLDGRVMLITD